jgi:hypothetical protein
MTLSEEKLNKEAVSDVVIVVRDTVEEIGAAVEVVEDAVQSKI